MTIYTNFDNEVINYKTIALKRTVQTYKQIGDTKYWYREF